MQFRAVKGMPDILPDEIGRWQRLEATFRRVVERGGYSEVRTPILEPTDLFVRSVGETTDIVEKEMYQIDHHGESLTVRPEGTAGAARAYVQHSVHAREPVTRWYYLGPMFRAERPQRGRSRQFHQAGCELFGDAGPASDAETLDLLLGFFRELGIGDLELCINTMGGPDTRARYRQALLDYLRPHAASLSEHARARLEHNPLRVLDSKDPKDQAFQAGAPSIQDVLSEPDRAHWQGLLGFLSALGTPYKVDGSLVRGLDYYTRTVFEIKSAAGQLGAQNTLAGGGRYDGLVKSLGGPEVPAFGFALGIERVLLAMPESAESRARVCYIAPIGSRAQADALVLARELRGAGLGVDVDARGNSLKSMLRRADALGARFCLVFGDAELDRGIVQLKELSAHQQSELPRSAIVSHLIEQFSRSDG
jgi:histidyl-tRNA synthetase